MWWYFTIFGYFRIEMRKYYNEAGPQYCDNKDYVKQYKFRMGIKQSPFILLHW